MTETTEQVERTPGTSLSADAPAEVRGASEERAADRASAGKGTRPAPPGNPAWGAILHLYPSLGNPDYRLLFLGNLPSTLAYQLSLVAAPYAAFDLVGSATILGIVSLASGLPILMFSLIGGVVADRVPRRTILLVTQGVLGLVALALAALALSGTLHVWHLLVAGFVQGTAFSFNMPARQAFVGQIVGRGLLRNAVALNNAGMNFSRVAGPALGGLLLALPGVGVGGAFAVMTVLYVAVWLAIFRLPHRPVEGGASREHPWAQLLEGLRYIWSNPTVLTLLGMGFITLFFGMPYQTLMPVFAERVFDVGAGGLGVLMAAIGVGALLGSLAIAALSEHRHPALLQVGFGVGFGVALVGFGLAPSFAVALALLVVVGFLSSAYSALNNTLVIGNTTPRLYGRVMSVYMFTFATMPVGALPLAWGADQIGAPLAVALAGAVVALVIAAVFVFYPPYRAIR